MPLFTSLVILLIVARVAGEITERLGQPATIGEALAGILLGPSLLGVIQVTPELVALPAQTPPHPTVARIVARHIAARGGSERLGRIRTLRLAGRILLPTGMLGADTVELARPLRIRTTMHFAGATLVQAYDGHTAWGTSPFQGDTTPRPLEAENARNVIAGADLDGPLVNYRVKGNRVTLMGVDTADGRPAYVLRVVRRDGTEDVYYIDTTSALQVKWQGHRMQNGAPVVFDTYSRDYRRVSGVMMAFRLDSEIRGRPGATHILFDTVVVNLPMDRSRFVMPGARSR